MKNLIKIAICLSMPMSAFAEQPSCSTDSNLDQFLVHTHREVKAIANMNDSLDARANAALSACQNCKGNQKIVWSSAAAAIVGGAAWAYYSNRKLNIADAKLDRAFKATYNERRINRLMYDKSSYAGKTIFGVFTALLAVPLAGLVSRTYEQMNELDIKGDKGTQIRLKQSGEATLAQLPGSATVTTATLLDAQITQLTAYRISLNDKLSDMRATTQAQLDGLAPGSEPYTRVQLAGLRQEQAILVAASQKLQDEQDAAALVCLKLDELGQANAELGQAKAKLAPQVEKEEAGLR